MKVIVALSICVIAIACDPAQDSSNWLFEAKSDSHGVSSCVSQNGGVNDLGNAPTMCEGDVTSVRLEVRKGKAECLKAVAEECGIPMRNFVSLDYDFSISKCSGIWAAPLWMTPHVWQWGAASGEIDSLEFCPRTTVVMNFAGGGHQVQLSNVSMDEAEGHITVRKDENGIVTISHCNRTNERTAQCPEPEYSTCQDCLSSSKDFSCWCNEPENIYGSGGCKNGGDCIWTLVSDIWNGVTGDSGYAGCMTEVPGVVDAGQPNLNSECVIGVERILLRGNATTNETLTFSSESPDKCKQFTL